MSDIIYSVLTNNDLLKEITKWHILDHLNNHEKLIKILCQDKNIDNLIFILKEKYITFDILDESTTLHISKFNYFDYKPLFLDYAYFANSTNITKYFNYDMKCRADLTIYMQNIFNDLKDNHNFIKFYNYLPDDNIFDKFIYNFSTYKLHDNVNIKNLFDDMNYNSFNHCITIGDYGTQYDLDELHFNDNLLKFLIKSNLITLDFLENLFTNDDNKQNIVIKKSIAYLLYKNYSETLRYILWKFPNEKNELNNVCKNNKTIDFLISHNIETIVVLLENNISSLHNECITYLFKYRKYRNNDVGLGKIYNTIYNTFKNLNIYQNITNLIDNTDDLTLYKIHEYIIKYELGYNSEATNNIIMCHMPKFVEHFNTLSIQMKKECVNYLLDNDRKLISKIILDPDITVEFRAKLEILIENNMYENAFDYVSNYEVPEIKYSKLPIIMDMFIVIMITNILKLLEYTDSNAKKDIIYDKLQKMYISKNFINLIAQNKTDEWNKIKTYFTQFPIELIDEQIYDFINMNKLTFAKLYENYPQITDMNKDIHDILFSHLVLQNSNPYNETIEKLITNYCIKIIVEQIDNIITCYSPEFVDHFKSLSVNMKNKCLKYLLKNDEFKLLSEIILDKDINVDFNVKLKILLENQKYDDVINCILSNNNNNKYNVIEKLYNNSIKIDPHSILTGVKTNPNKQLSNTQSEDNILINDAINESEISVNIHNLLDYIYKNNLDDINLIKIIFSKVHIQDKILIITNLPKSLNNFNDIFVMLCDILLEEIVTYHKMLYCIKNCDDNIINNDIPDDLNDGFPMGMRLNNGVPMGMDFEHFDRHRTKKQKVNINDFAKCLSCIVENDVQKEIIIEEQKSKNTNTSFFTKCLSYIFDNDIQKEIIIEKSDIKKTDQFLIDNILLQNSDIDFMDLAYNTILLNQHIMNFVNEYDLNIQENIFTNNYIIKNIITQNMLNKGKYDKFEKLNYKMIHMTPNIYRKNCKNIDFIINNVVVPNHNMLITIYNYSKTLPKCYDVKLNELQTFLQSIQTKFSDGDIYDNILCYKKNWIGTDIWLLEYFIKNNMPKCLSIYLNNCDIKYNDSHVKMAKQSELLNILTQNKHLYMKENMPSKISVKIEL